MFWLSFSVLASSGFEGKKELSLKKLKESGAAQENIDCVEKSVNRKEMNKCYKGMQKESKQKRKRSKSKAKEAEHDTE